MKKKALLLFLLSLSPLLQAEGIYLIVNPISGDIDKEPIVKELQKSFNPKVFYTEYGGHATLLAKQAVDEKADMVIAVGGDGTINEVGQALIGSQTALAIIPTGSGNGLAHSLHIPKDIDHAISIIKEGKALTIDTVRINDRTFFGVAGVGFDAEIADRFADFGHRGFASYVAVVLQTWPHYHPDRYELIVDGEKRCEKAFLITFANSPEFGNKAQIAPKARMDDGKLDIVIIRPFPFFAAADLTYRLFHGTLHHSSYVKTLQAKEVILPYPHLKMQIDGEPITFDTGAHLTLNPASLKVIVPASFAAQPMGRVVGELQEKWQFPSDHLPIASTIDDCNLVSWNVLDSDYMKWVTENSQGLSRSMIIDEHQYIGDTGLTVRDQHIVDLILQMISHPTHPRSLLALQECNLPFIKELSSRLPSHFGVIGKDNVLLYDLTLFEKVEANEITGIFENQPERSFQDIVLRRRDNGELFRLINVHLPGDPAHPPCLAFADYIQRTFDPTLTTVAMGDMNFNELEMSAAMEKAFSKNSPFSIHSPYCTNIGPTTFNSKAIDHFIYYSPDGSSLALNSPNQIMAGLDKIVALL